MLTYKLTVGSHEWLYDGPHAIYRAKFAARLMLRRLSLKTAFITPYGFHGETIIIGQ